MLLQKSLDCGEYREEPEGMKTRVCRKGGPVLETMAIYASPSRIVRVSKAAYVYAQQRHMDHATRKSSCLHFNEASATILSKQCWYTIPTNGNGPFQARARET